MDGGWSLENNIFLPLFWWCLDRKGCDLGWSISSVVVGWLAGPDHISCPSCQDGSEWVANWHSKYIHLNMVYRDMGISAVSCNWPQGKSELYRKRQEYEEEEFCSPGIERNCCSSLEQLLLTPHVKEWCTRSGISSSSSSSAQSSQLRPLSGY